MKTNLTVKLATLVGALCGMSALALDLDLPLVGVESRNYPQSKGGYASGSLVDADAFLNDSAYTVKLFPNRERNYASLDLVSIITNAARAMKEIRPDAERIQIGDFSKRTGGYISGHGSHQNGLDVDMSYYRTDNFELDPRTATEFPIEYVQNGRLSEKFDLEKNLKFFRLLESTGRISRIFVDPVIKVKLCEYAASIGRKEALREVLRKLRPYARHGDHMHVRITCPAGSKTCRPQPPVPAGDGCAEAAASALQMHGRRGFLPEDAGYDELHDEEGC